MESPKPFLRLRCSVQNYDWGRLGEESKVARLFSHNSSAEVDPAKPYAEFWMGTHDSGPSFLAGDGAAAVTLKSWVLENPSALGEKVAARWGGDLPFLFKVLSVAKALSIQAHPDKDLAEALHKMRPSIYKDANHKPEMAIAVTEFKALCGFVSSEEVKDVLTTVPEIQELVGYREASDVIKNNEHEGNIEIKASLQSIFTKIMSASNEAVSEAVLKLKGRLNLESKVRTLTEKEQLVLLLEKQYPADIGVISAYFFNYVKLSPGEALYIGANEPHAYLSGECIECMATSDNVVRAGLTPKYRDVQTLCSMLTYKQGFPEILGGTPLDRNISRYTPPFDEFEVDRFLLVPEESVVFSIPGPSIFVVLTGEGRIQRDAAAGEEMVMEGDVFFLPAHSEIRLSAAVAGPLQLYRAGVNSRFFY
ncbi:mannose-6-phosphate isomerase 1-like [Typha latifolia]|uniref:mannose-6-phosphate isomerase 1-like n=1 Tax=Typha latifolia TaxID=4733 RepID=UPI003C2EC6B1